MNVIIIQKGTFNTNSITGVKNIAFASNIYSITLSDDTVVQYDATVYQISILW